jgi:tRNA (guanine37-N1)-methyltransferase
MKMAQEKWLFFPVLHNLCDYSVQNTRRVDDKAYGMHGQVICPEPLSICLEKIFSDIGKKVPVVFLSPSGDLLNQEKIENFLEILWDEIIIICGHYEWIDQRIIDLYVTHKISIGEYVLSSGELSAMVFIDSLVRLIPWVLGKSISFEEESFSKKLNRQKEYPVYTKPRTFLWMDVPDVLLSGNHAEIEKWKKNNLT